MLTPEFLMYLMIKKRMNFGLTIGAQAEKQTPQYLLLLGYYQNRFLFKLLISENIWEKDKGIALENNPSDLEVRLFSVHS